MVESTDQPPRKPICPNIQNWVSYIAGTADVSDVLRLLVKRIRPESIVERRLRRRQLTETGNVEISGLDLR
jgi:hypothetical protein